MVTDDGRSRITLPDGRRLDVWSGGAADGAPVVFHHGTPGGRLQAALGEGAARRVGVHLVGVSRPGYGGSTDAPTTVSSVARDTVCAADALGLGPFAVLGVSGGGPFALATAALAAERVTATGVVAGVGPLRELEPALNAEPWLHAALRGHADEAIALLEVVDPHPSVYAPRSARHPHRARHPEGAGARWSTRLPLPPEILEPWLPGGRPGAPAYRGATRDTLAFACGWDVDLAAVTAPVWLWYGETDRMVPVEHGRWLHEHLPTSTLVVREGVGHLGTLMPYWGEILTTLGRGWVGSSA